MKKFFRKNGRRFVYTATTGMVLFSSFVSFSYSYLEYRAEGNVYSSADHVPFNRVGLVLGSSKYLGGRPNPFFARRIEAAARLFQAGKIRHLIVSGDNSRKDYDESSDMKLALMALGVPDSCITPDYAGFRTLDSVIRCKEIFGVDSVTVISQEFHNVRAIFLAETAGMYAVGFNAEDAPQVYSAGTARREWLARTKAVLDVYILGTEPKFLGKRESL